MILIDRTYCLIQLTLHKATDQFHVPRQSLDSCESRKKGKVAIFGEDNKSTITLRHYARIFSRRKAVEDAGRRTSEFHLESIKAFAS